VDITEVLVRVRTHLALRSMQFRLEALSISDPLTGLANRRRFDEVLRSEWVRALRGNGSIGAVMIDIDHFKRYNDHYGHVNGDRCLRGVAEVLQAAVRQDVDLAARYGGEEFVLVLPGADPASAAEVAARAHAAVLALREPHAASELGYVTVSVGVVSLVPTDEMGAGRLVELADSALYRAKQQGRNQVAVYDVAPRGVAEVPLARTPCHAERLDALPGNQLQWTLLDSRQRWRDLAIMAADIGFETDNQGRFTFIAPDQALGWPSALLLDQPADMLLSPISATDCFNPFQITTSVRRRRTWFKRPDGSVALLAITAAPLLDAQGQPVGVRGIGVDWVDYDEFPARVAADLLRGQVLEYLLQRIGEEKLAPRMLNATLDSLMHALGAEGAAVIDVHADASVPTLVCQIGEPGDYVIEAAAVLIGTTSAPATAVVRCGRSIVVARCGNFSGGGVVGAAFWRDADCRGWDHEDKRLISGAIGLIGVILACCRHDSQDGRTELLSV
jgi:diguanylate cyclase (GGDEF)-like protein